MSCPDGFQLEIRAEGDVCRGEQPDGGLTSGTCAHAHTTTILQETAQGHRASAGLCLVPGLGAAWTGWTCPRGCVETGPRLSESRCSLFSLFSLFSLLASASGGAPPSCQALGIRGVVRDCSGMKRCPLCPVHSAGHCLGSPCRVQAPLLLMAAVWPLHSAREDVVRCLDRYARFGMVGHFCEHCMLFPQR